MTGPIRELVELCRGLRAGTYPAFVTGRELGGEIPVFLYHVVDAAQLEQHFDFVRKNGYATLTADQHREALSLSPRPGERRIVITFDDGLADLYDLAFPCIERHGVHVVAFLIPARVGQPGMASWDQVRQMHASGLVDFQSHSMHHVAIPTSPEIVDFHHPRRHYYRAWDAPVDAGWTEGVPAFPPPLGFPIFRHGSRLADAARFVPSAPYEASFSEHVARNGGAAFFERRGWRAELQHLVRAPEDASACGRLEEPREQEQAMRTELARSRERIEEELPGKRVRHLAYPWNLGGRRVEQLLEQAGYASAYAGLTSHRGPASLKGPSFDLARVNGDYVMTLPGEGRVGLLPTLGYKALRRLTKGLPY